MTASKISATFQLEGATQVINMTQEAYDYMTSKECPEWAKKGEWVKMSPTQRLIKHLARTMEFLGASKFTFEVFPD